MMLRVTVTVTERTRQSVTQVARWTRESAHVGKAHESPPGADANWIASAVRRALDLLKRQRPPKLLPVLLVALLLPATRLDAQRQNQPVTVADLLQQAMDAGNASLQNGDKTLRNTAKARLDQAESMTSKALKQNPQCAPCLQDLAQNYYYRASFNLGKKFDDCIAEARRGFAQQPNQAVFLFYAGACEYGKQDFAGATRDLGRYVASPGVNPGAAQFAKGLLNTSQQHFLSEWYTQASFYQANDSRIVWYNGQAARWDLLFQMTPQYELGLGEQGFAQMTSWGPSVADAALLNYLQALTNRLVSQTQGGPPFQYRVTVINSGEINAAAVPGHISINTGLLAFVASESELAAVISHEIGHNYAHHAARRLIKTYEAQALVKQLVNQVNPQSVVSQSLTQIAAQAGLGLFVNAYSRNEEKEADLYGTHILFNGGYNPIAMSKVFLAMYQAMPTQPLKFLSNHPPLPDRVDYLTDYLQSFPLDRELALDSQTFHTIVKARYPGQGGR